MKSIQEKMAELQAQITDIAIKLPDEESAKLCPNCDGVCSIETISSWSQETRSYSDYEIPENGLAFCPDCNEEFSINDCVDSKRICDVTGEPMSKGFVWGDGDSYTKHEEDVLKECNENMAMIIIAYKNSNPPKEMREKLDNKTWTNKDLLTMAFEIGEVYWTEWEDE